MNIASELVKIAKSLVADRMQFSIYGLNPNPLVFDSEEDLIRGLANKGIHQSGVQNSRSLRRELQGKPMFDKLLGPMWNGPRGIRYETQEMYNALSE